MPTVNSEVSSLISLLEGSIPANPRSPSNERKASRLERKLQDYFKALEQAFPYDQLDAIYYANVSQE